MKISTLKTNIFYSFSIFYLLLVVILMNHQSDNFVHLAHTFLIFLLFLLIFIFLNKNIYYCKTNIFIFFLFFVFIFLNMLVSTILFGNVPSSNISGLFNKIIAMAIFIMLLFFLNISFKFDSNTLLKYSLIFFIAVSIFSGISAVQEFFTGTALFGPLFISEARHPDPRLSGFFYNPNELGFVLIVGVLAIFHFLFHETSKSKKLIFLLLLIFLLVVLIASGSKKAIFGFFLGIFFYSFLYLFFIKNPVHLKRYILKSLVYLTVFCLAVVYLLFFAIGFDEFFLLIGADVGKMGTLTGRTDIWQSVPVIMQNAAIYEIIWGHGNDYFVFYTTRSAHSAYIQLFIDYGAIVVLCILCFPLFTSILYLFKSRKIKNHNAIATLAILFYIYISAVAESALLNGKTSSYYFILILFIMLLPQKSRKENNENIIPIK